jgi:GNAT superfamily N-acetyltransferase
MAECEISIDCVAFSSPAARAVVAAAEDELDRRYGPSTDREGFAPEIFERPHGAFLVARLDGHLAGGVGLRRLDATHAEIKRLWVRPDLRRIGVGTKLMQAAEAEGAALGYDVIVLETGPLQPEAIAFYEAEGWTRVERLPVEVSKYPDAIRFVKGA